MSAQMSYTNKAKISGFNPLKNNITSKIIILNIIYSELSPNTFNIKNRYIKNRSLKRKNLNLKVIFNPKKKLNINNQKNL